MNGSPHLDDRLFALLGADGPDIGCDRCFAELDRYVEIAMAGRDANAEVPGMRAHLDGCPACAEERDSLIELVRVHMTTGDAE